MLNKEDGFNVFAEEKLVSESVLKDFFTTADDGKQYRTKHYNLDVTGIIEEKHERTT